MKVKNNQIFYKRKDFQKLSKEQLKQFFNIFYLVYKKNYKNITKRYLYIVAHKPIQIISDAIFFHKKISFENNKIKFLKIGKSSIDLDECANNDLVLKNINFLKSVNLSRTKLKYKIRNFNIIEKKPKLKISFFTRIIEFFFKKNKIILLDIIKLKFYLALIKKGYLPTFIDKSQFFKNVETSYNEIYRKKLFLTAKKIFLKNKKNFDKLSLKEINIFFLLLPINIIENFNDLRVYNPKNLFQKIHKVLISQTGNNDEFNFWIANQVCNKKVKFEIFQHGAGYNFLDYDPLHEKELIMSDKFYTWTKTKNKKQKQIPVFKIINLRKNRNHDILLINSDWPYFYKVASGPFANLRDHNRNEQIKFINRISFTNNILVKQPPVLYSGYLELYKREKLDRLLTNENIYNLISRSKICVCSYLGTPFFELMANDIPFVLFSAKNANVYGYEVKKHMLKLNKFGFYHYNSQSAANFLNNNSNSEILDLWNNKEFSDFRKKFRENYCKKNENNQFF